MTRYATRFVLLLSLTSPWTSGSVAAGEPIAFEVTFAKEVRTEPFSGRVLIFLSPAPEEEPADDGILRGRGGEPRMGYGWTTRRPLFSADVRDWKPGTTQRIDKVQGYPHPLDELAAGRYRIQAVMHANLDVPHSGTAVGSLFSEVVTEELDPATGGTVRLHIDKIVKPRRRSRRQSAGEEVELRSERMSRFFGRDVYLRAAVVLPEEYDEDKERRFPALYVIPGFGGDHFQSAGYSRMLRGFKTPFVIVGLDATSPHGHHVFADSDNCGPAGTALVKELIPHLEKKYRLIAEPAARLLTGHSSGGWSSLWIQVCWPDFFGGTWSTAPDSVTFHDFCAINLYDKKSNFYVDASGEPRPIIRRGGKVRLRLKDFVALEDVMGPGGQIHSFEAVFGPRGADGLPKRLFDRRTGAIDRTVLEAWRRYDIVEKLKREWKTLGPKLSGKITVLVGDEDNFYLEGAARILKKTLSDLGSDARVVIEEDRDHRSLMWAESFQRMAAEMSDRFLASRGAEGPSGERSEASASKRQQTAASKP